MTGNAIVPRGWLREHPERRQDFPEAGASETDASLPPGLCQLPGASFLAVCQHVRCAIRTAPHEHRYTVCCICPCGLQICAWCGGWQERIEGWAP